MKTLPSVKEKCVFTVVFVKKRNSIYSNTLKSYPRVHPLIILYSLELPEVLVIYIFNFLGLIVIGAH